MTSEDRSKALEEARELLFASIKEEGIILRKNLPRSIRSRSGKGLAWLVDLRQLFLRPAFLDAFATLFWERYADRAPLQIGGLATGALPFVTALVMEGHKRGIECNAFIVRKERKESGMCNQIEGDLSERPVILVDDLLNSGSSVERVQLALKQLDHSITEAFFIIDFVRQSAREYLESEGISAHSVFTADDFSLPTTSVSTWVEPTIEIEWVFTPDNPNYSFNFPNSTPVCDDTHVYFGGSDQFFYALEQESGECVWRFRVGKTPKSILSSPALHEGVVYFGAYDGNVYAIHGQTGTPVWAHTESDFIGSSPTIAPDLGLLFIGAEYATDGNRGALLALSLDEGQTLWWMPVQEFLHGSPVYLPDRKEVAIGTNDGFVMLCDAQSGKVKWRFRTGGPIKHSLAYDQERGLLCFGSFDKHIYGVDVETAEERFCIPTENIIYSTPLIVEDRLFCPSTDRSMYVINLDSGEIAKKVPSFGKLYSSPSLIDGLVYWGGNDGLLRGVNPKTCSRRQWIRVAERLLSHPVKGKSGLIFINGAGSTLYALRPGEETAVERVH